jgi:glycosyltransferase involved in cell wall biosynthesis
MNDLPFVSIIMPCRNEERFIGMCLDSIIANDYPKDRLEVLVVDGMSEDQTRAIVEKYAKKHSFINLYENSQLIAPVAQNMGIRQSRGDVIVIMDAHDTYAPDYISKCIEYMYNYNVDHVGGIWKIIPREDTIFSKAIVCALSHPFGAGNAYYRTTKCGKPRFTDAAAFGCYKREVFEKIGLFDENLARSYDFDFNLRLRNLGSKMLLVPDAIIYYYARSTFMSFVKHNFINGFWVTYPLKFGKTVFSFRHTVPLAFVTGLLGSAALIPGWQVSIWILACIAVTYALANLTASVQVAIRYRNLQYSLVMPVVFTSMHIGYGLGSLVGLAIVIASRLVGIVRRGGRG